MKETRVDISEFECITTKVAKTTDGLQGAYDTLMRITTINNGCWGNDDTGKQFSNQYVPNVGKFFEQTSPMMKQLTADVLNLTNAPKQIEGQDGENAGQI